MDRDMRHACRKIFGTGIIKRSTAMMPILCHEVMMAQLVACTDAMSMDVNSNPCNNPDFSMK